MLWLVTNKCQKFPNFKFPGNFPPNITGSSTLRVNLEEEAVYMFTVVDDSGNFTVALEGLENSTLINNGNGSYHIRWALKEPTVTPVSIIAVDDKGATSELTLIVEVCACKNNGNCTLLGTPPQNVSSTIIMNCDCPNGMKCTLVAIVIIHYITYTFSIHWSLL